MKHHFLALLLLNSFALSAQNEITISSPDGKQVAVFGQEKSQGKTLEGTPCTIYKNYYSMQYDGKVVLEKSHLGLNMDNRAWEMALGFQLLPQYESWMDALELDSIVTHPMVEQVYEPIFGEKKSYPDTYNSCTLYLSRKPEKMIQQRTAPLGFNKVPKDGIVKSKYRVNIEVRMYNEGLAFRYWFPEHPDAIFHKIIKDETEYTLPEGTMCWGQQWAQSKHEHKSVSDLKYPVEMALTMDYKSGIWASLMCADLDEWCHSKLKTLAGNTIETVMESPVDAVTYFGTPWKLVLAGSSATEVAMQNYLVDLVNPPSQLPDAAEWCIPGKMIRVMDLNNKGGKEYIDFCAAHNILYALFCWKWYMPVTSFDGDATKPVPGLDIKEMCDYAKSKGVGVWVYVNQHGLMNQLDEILPLYKEWGVVGIKPGFVEYKTHYWSVWVHDVVRAAAKYKLMVDLHDEYRPNGFSRTYPNLMTQEGICGSEEFPDADHNVTLPFTRLINGSADYTVGYYDKRIPNTHAHQMATAVTYYCPVPSLFWYDRPRNYENEPEIEWFEQLPTVWDDTKMLGGEPGKYVITARQKDGVWYVGAMTGNEGRTVSIDLSQLLPADGRSVGIKLYEDDMTVNTKTHVRIREQKIKKLNKKNCILTLNLMDKGGACLIINDFGKGR